MKVIAVYSPKGGVGKSTIALNLSAALVEAGYSVHLADLDPQQSGTDIFFEGKLPFEVSVGWPMERPDVDFLITDNPPGKQAKPVGDVVITVTPPKPLEVRASMRQAKLLEGMNIINVVNLTDWRIIEQRQAALIMQEEGGVIIRQRNIFAKTLGLGMTVFNEEAGAAAREAKTDINKLKDKLLETLSIKQGRAA